MDPSRYSGILGDGHMPEFNPNMWSIRVNTIKASPGDLIEVFREAGYRPEAIPWEPSGFWIETEDIITKLDDHREGNFFSQSASSMIPPVVLDPSEDDVVLDMAASPGSKTTQMAAMMRNEGAIIANDVDRQRLKILKINLHRCGVMNTATVMNRGQDIWKSGMKFDKILLDAPCTGTGSMNPRILRETGERTVDGFSKRQRSLVMSAAKCLADGGELVYSTCSMEPEENEGVVDFAVRELGMRTKRIEADVPKKFRMSPLGEWEGESFCDDVKNSMRILPTEKTEGFFVCALSL